MPLKRQRRARGGCPRGVVVDHVEDDLDAGRVQRLHHALELALRPGAAVGGVARLGREEAERVVAPVVAQALLDQAVVVDEGVHRQQLDRGDAEALAGARSPAAMRQPGVGAAQLLRHVGVPLA